MRYMSGIQSEGTKRKHHAYGQEGVEGWSMRAPRSLDYRVEAAIKGFTGILGAVDEALDLFDVIGTKESNGKMTSEFLKYLWILYAMGLSTAPSWSA